MSVEAVGAAAIFAEGTVFFILQEPEVVSRMGSVGRYFVGLFSGWVALMSASSLILLFLPLLFPDRFRSPSAIPAWCIWLGAALCFLATNFMVWHREHKRAEHAETSLREIEKAKPCLKLMEPGAVYVEDVGQSFSDGRTLYSQNAPFLKVRFVNDPPNSFPLANAKGVRAFLDYYRLPEESHVLHLDGRWAESDQPPAHPPLASKAHLLAVEFGIGEKRSVDLAYYDARTRQYYAWNNDNYNYPFFTCPTHVLTGERFRVHIRLRGDWVDKSVVITFRTENSGFAIEDVK